MLKKIEIEKKKEIDRLKILKDVMKMDNHVLTMT